MTEKEYAQVIAKNLKRIAFERDKTQAQEICAHTGQYSCRRWDSNPHKMMILTRIVIDS